MSDMEHMAERWWVGQRDGGEYCVRAAESGLLVASCPSYISDRDPTGERTARAIVDAHNAALEAKPAPAAPVDDASRQVTAQIAARLGLIAADALIEGADASLDGRREREG